MIQTIKPTVKYDVMKGVRYEQWDGEERAFVWPINHSSGWVSNRHEARTSPVVQKYDDGVFETLNTVYVPGERV